MTGGSRRLHGLAQLTGSERPMTEPYASCANDPTLGAEALNAACFCISLDEAALHRALDAELGEPGLAALVAARCPYLFSARPVFLSAARLRQR